ncbi:hypothetical protein [Pseudarthrobacter sp. fls2-241-R2A-168]|uniref:hypothetical protein n=1 Tax=Pseudarthrobacter sp. fls2-241-R2A-168 TaxID=3040304 RepID=UPI00255401BE|nr:hypothetical protein [Pseudarthrobacter sp. fls2-241-R2A-168]
MAAAERLEAQLPEVTAKGLAVDLAWSSVKVSVLQRGQRRLEASSYLTDGYGQRQLIEARPSGWKRMEDVAEVWQPSRLKGVVVRPHAGLPFLSAGQVFEAAPVVRKWLATSHVPNRAERYVKSDWLLMSCSGRVGRITAVYPHHEDLVVTHDLLRIVPKSKTDYGWLYAYMRTKAFGGIAQSSQYGHMIKHLEPEHVQRMPVVEPAAEIKQRVAALVEKIMEKRRDAMQIKAVADDLYESLIDPEGTSLDSSVGGPVPINLLLKARRRLDAQFVRPDFRQIDSFIRSASTRPVESVADVTDSVGLGGRFRRYYGEKGTPYRSAEELFDLNAPVTKRIYSALVPGSDEYVLRQGWIIMARSGQVYGLNGRCLLLTEAHEGIFGSDDLIRILPNADAIHPGYLLMVLTNQKFGRPMVIRNAYGTSIPHLDPMDIREIPVPRFSEDVEEQIGALMEEAAVLRDEADALENEATALAEATVADFIGVHELTSSHQEPSRLLRAKL